MIEEFQGKYRWLSNFWECEVIFEGQKYSCAENAYQAAKCADLKDRVKFCNITAGQSKRLGRKVNIRSDWDEVKLDVMRSIVTDKFLRNKQLQKKLIATGTQKITEGNAWGDRFWGVCKGVGRNELGKIIMDIRKKLQEQEE